MAFELTRGAQQQREWGGAGPLCPGQGRGARPQLHAGLTERGHLPQLPKLPLRPLKQNLWGCDPAMAYVGFPQGVPK